MLLRTKGMKVYYTYFLVDEWCCFLYLITCCCVGSYRPISVAGECVQSLRAMIRKKSSKTWQENILHISLK